jgi:diguanylate cyclase (GGDEF)-like protein
VKGILEAVTLAILSTILIWVTEFNQRETAFYALQSGGQLSLILIIVDIFIITQLLQLFAHSDKSRLSAFSVLTGTGYFIYAATDTACYIFGYHENYQALFVCGGLYVLGFSVAAAGALRRALFPETAQQQLVYKEAERSRNRGDSRRFWHILGHTAFLLLFPAAAMLVTGGNLNVLFVFAVTIGLFLLTLKYINQSESYEKQLSKQRNVNAQLEKRVEEQHTELTMLHNRDTVTKLYNRHYFTACLDKTIRLLRNNESVAVIQFDIDRFKTINDNYGHDFGDRVIIEIAQRLLGWNNPGAVLARLGGDEFAILIQGLYSRYELGEFCKQIIDLCSAPIFIDSRVLYLTISIGVSLYPCDAADSVTLLKNSDISMYKAKAEGYNKHVFYTSAFNENIRKKNEIEALLRKADLERDFELVYQPQFDLPDKRLIGAEALLRWRSAEHGYIPPSIFVPVAEEINYIGRIGAWVLAKAVGQIIRWNTDYGLDLKMGVNISPKQLSEKHFFSTLKALIAESGVNAAWLDAEITENIMIEEKTKVTPIFNLFRELKITVSIDDFGSGYSSLGYLSKFHFDRIKIDKSLIDNLLSPDGSGVEIVKAILNMADAVGKLTIAESVEKQGQLQILEELGCRQVQGYLLGRPVPAAEFEKLHIESAVGKQHRNGRSG